jgi:hypothetical protein
MVEKKNVFKKIKEKLDREANLRAKLNEVEADLKRANLEISRQKQENSRLTADLDNEKKINKILTNPNIALQQYNNFLKIFKKFEGQISKLHKEEEHPLVYRHALSVFAINNLAIPLSNIFSEDDKLYNSVKIIEKIKSDYLELVSFRATLKNLQDGMPAENLSEEIRTDILTKLDWAKGSIFEIKNPKVPEHIINEAIELQKSKELARVGQTFVDKMYETLVKDFWDLQNDIANSKVDMSIEENQKRFLTLVINIAYFTVGYVDRIARNNHYAYNYMLLENDFKYDTTNSQEFVLHHAFQSTPFANTIFKLTQTFGLDPKDLKFTVDKYAIGGHKVNAR